MVMPRISPLPVADAAPDIRAAFERHVAEYGGRITNMKATLGHSLTAFEVYMGWYPLYEELRAIVGDRLAYLYAHAISMGTNCPLCTTFFRKIIIDHGEHPENLALSEEEQTLLDFGAAIADNKGEAPEALYRRIARRYTEIEIVVLVAFAGQMIATNIFNNALEVDIDEYLHPYLPASANFMRETL
jgi:hypothetical protein